MSVNPHSPLNDDHLKQLNAALQQITVAESQVLLAKQAKIDVSVQEKELSDSRQRILALKNTYFPGAV